MKENIETVIDRYADMVKRICFVHLKNQADTEDIFQSVFLKYYSLNPSFESLEHEKAWFIKVSINACNDLLKNFYRRNKVSIDDIIEHEQIKNDEHKEVLEAVLNLPSKYKDPIYLHYYEGYSAKEIASIMHKSENTIYSLLHRARKQLKDVLGEYYEQN